MNIVVLIITIFSIITFGGGGALFVYLKMMPKKPSWNAMVFQLGEGVRPVKYNNKGKPITSYNLKDLIPYDEDMLVKEEKQHGITIFRLQRLNITTNPVSAKDVMLWRDKKLVFVLIDNEQASILNFGYDPDVGNMIFQPMQRERIEMLTNQIVTKKARFDKDKDTLAKITPFVVAGMWILALVASSYFIANGWIQSSKEQADADKTLAEASIKSAELYRDALRSVGSIQKMPEKTENIKNINDNKEEQQEKPPPMIE